VLVHLHDEDTASMASVKYQVDISEAELEVFIVSSHEPEHTGSSMLLTQSLFVFKQDICSNYLYKLFAAH
jgi:hypothetical protein